MNPHADTTLAHPAVALPQRRPPLVAVLPFTPRGGDESLGLLGSDIADALRERLTQDPAMQAILISSEFLSKAPPHAVELICRELRIGFLVSGHCHPTTPASLYVELTDTRDWHIRWAHFFRGTAPALLAPGAEGMTRMVAGLRRELVEFPRR